MQIYLGVVDLQCAAAGVDVAPVQGFPGSGGGIDAVERARRETDLLVKEKFGCC